MEYIPYIYILVHILLVFSTDRKDFFKTLLRWNMITLFIIRSLNNFLKSQ